VVAGRSGGAPETVRPGETGRLVDGRDRADVADTLADLLIDPDTGRAMGEAGRRWMRADWTWDARAARLRALAAG
jgi:phosphatidylinositol alpha-1,6-mannosyltransferase